MRVTSSSSRVLRAAPTASALAAPTAAALALIALAPACSESAAEHARPHVVMPSLLDGEGRVRLAPEARSYIQLQTVQPQAGGTAIRAPGRVAFMDGATAQVGAPIHGRVTRLHVQVGQRVEAGDALIELSSPEAAAARAALESALSALRVAEDAATRERNMLTQGIGIEREQVAAEARLREAQTEVARARTTVSYLGPGAGPTVVVRAPIAGTVLSRAATAGAFFEPGGNALIEIGNPSALRVVAEVFERDLPLVQGGAPVEVELSALRRTVRGRVVAGSPVLAGGLRTAPVYIDLDDDSVDLRPGMYARVSIQTATNTDIFLPARAVLIKDGTRHVVYVKEGEDTFVMREVQVGRSIDGHVQILAGLDTGQEVVVAGALLLDGAAEMLL